MWLRAERLSETAIAFARAGSAPTETDIAFARAGSAPTETDIAFAGEKWAFWVRFLVAEVMVVSMVAVWGRALVMAVSCWPASAVAVVSLVSTSPPHSCLCAKKFAQRTKNGPQSAFYGVLGEFFRENTAGGVAPGEVFRGTAAEQSVLAEFCRTTTQARLLLGCLRIGSNRKAACWERHRRMGMKKALPKGVLGRNAEPPPVDRTEGGRCAPGGTRTPNLLNRNQMLYPLSYGRLPFGWI